MDPLLQKKKILLPLIADDEKAICNAANKPLPSTYHLTCWNLSSVQRKHGYVDME